LEEELPLSVQPVSVAVPTFARPLPASRIERARCLQDALNILEALDGDVLA
jgi:hypothetical protein